MRTFIGFVLGCATGNQIVSVVLAPSPALIAWELVLLLFLATATVLNVVSK